ncbi:hypothetical protein B0H11DRAFT_2201994 [Mycena galericulata]|nr:hypothetical protein B0H11DRAFT_2201994 [Mycena galericulata]
MYNGLDYPRNFGIQGSRTAPDAVRGAFEMTDFNYFKNRGTYIQVSGIPHAVSVVRVGVSETKPYADCQPIGYDRRHDRRVQCRLCPGAKVDYYNPVNSERLKPKPTQTIAPMDSEFESTGRSISIDGKIISVPVLKVADFCKEYHLSDDVRELLENEKFETAGALLEVAEGSLEKSGFTQAQIGELKRALKEFLAARMVMGPMS